LFDCIRAICCENCKVATDSSHRMSIKIPLPAKQLNMALIHTHRRADQTSYMPTNHGSSISGGQNIRDKYFKQLGTIPPLKQLRYTR